MIRSIGLLELTSIARGVECADTMLKTADVELIMSNPVCPGKYIVIVSGDVSAINASIDAGKEIGGEYIVGEFVLASIHEDLIAAMNRAVSSEPNKSLGIVECFSIAAALEGADAAAKAADVILFDVRAGVGIGGKSFFVVIGDVSAVQAAVDAGLNIINNKYGSLITSVVIPNPKQEVIDLL
jgi:microcompartment protein CcmL/EutN